MADLWHYIDVGLKVEVENTDSYDFCEEFPNSFWIASVLRVEGELIYLIKLLVFPQSPLDNYFMSPKKTYAPEVKLKCL